MINREKLIETVNKSVHYNKGALTNVCRGKVFAVALSENK